MNAAMYLGPHTADNFIVVSMQIGTSIKIRGITNRTKRDNSRDATNVFICLIMHLP